MLVSRMVWRLWDEVLNTCGKRGFVEHRKKSTVPISGHPEVEHILPRCALFKSVRYEEQIETT
jgi:hypothetical protein